MNMNMTESLLVMPYTSPARELPIALAHQIARTRLNEPYMAVLNRLYTALPWADRAKCRAELHRCRAAQRGASVAQCG